MWRIALFYVGSMAVIVTLIPWNATEVAKKRPVRGRPRPPRHPGAGQIMNVVILVALLSAMNANLYGSSRMAYSLIARGQGPAPRQGQRRRPAPRRPASAAFGFLACC